MAELEDSKQTKPDHRPFLSRAVAASPLGALALIGGVALAIVFLVQFESLLDGVENNDLHAAIRALQITVCCVWIVMSLWGWYLIHDGLERVQANRRLKEQAELIGRIHEAIEERDAEKAHKHEVVEKTRSFWNWRRSEF